MSIQVFRGYAGAVLQRYQVPTVSEPQAQQTTFIQALFTSSDTDTDSTPPSSSKESKRKDDDEDEKNHLATVLVLVGIAAAGVAVVGIARNIGSIRGHRQIYSKTNEMKKKVKRFRRQEVPPIDNRTLNLFGRLVKAVKSIEEKQLNNYKWNAKTFASLLLGGVSLAYGAYYEHDFVTKCGGAVVIASSIVGLGRYCYQLGVDSSRSDRESACSLASQFLDHTSRRNSISVNEGY